MEKWTKDNDYNNEGEKLNESTILLLTVPNIMPHGSFNRFSFKFL